MHRIFQTFIDQLAENTDKIALQEALSVAAKAPDLHCFAYLALPTKQGGDAKLISTYPSTWTAHYLNSRYERLDPVIIQALRDPDPFE